MIESLLKVWSISANKTGLVYQIQYQNHMYKSSKILLKNACNDQSWKVMKYGNEWCPRGWKRSQKIFKVRRLMFKPLWMLKQILWGKWLWQKNLQTIKTINFEYIKLLTHHTQNIGQKVQSRTLKRATYHSLNLENQYTTKAQKYLAIH